MASCNLQFTNRRHTTDQGFISVATTIPLDLIAAEILPRLPTKSVLRFKCVCKSWYTLTSNQEFAKLHLRLSPASDSNSQIILNFDSVLERSHKRIISLDVHDLWASQSRAIWQIDFPFKKCPLTNHNHGRVKIVGSCNGILCVSRQYCSYSNIFHNCIALLNPSIGMFKEICHCDKQVAYKNNLHSVNFGFGYDDHLDDYKIVKIETDFCPTSRMYESSVSVYSLKPNYWRQINDNLPSGELLNSCSDVLVDNHLLHWKVLNEKYVPIIRCFNIRLERWVECVPWPNKYADDDMQKYTSVILGIVDRCLSVLINEEDRTLVLWVMKEHGIKDSWVKLCNFTGISHPWWVEGSVNQILVVKGSTRVDQLCFMKISDDKTATRLDVVHGIPFCSQALFCQRSLVAIPG